MKKTLFLIAAMVLAFTLSHAQTEKGNQTLGLNLGFGYSKDNSSVTIPTDFSTVTETTKQTSFNIGPAYSYFIADKLDLGGNLNYGTSTENFSPVPNYLSKLSSYNFGGTVYLRKYFMYQDKIGLRAGPYLGYNKLNSKAFYNGSSTGANQDNTTNRFSAGMRLELVYFPAKSLGFSAGLASLDYGHYKTDGGTQGKSSGDNIDLNLVSNGLSFSVFYVFGSK
jgi:hypothetical protein